jgi:hypothetical protein
MIRKALIALCLGASLGLISPQSVRAQGRAHSNGLGSDGGFVSPSRSGVSGLGAKNTAADSAAGSPGSAPETSLSRRSAGEPATREGDVPKQVGILAPVAFFMFLVLAGGLYWFVFRKPTTPEGEVAAQNQTTTNNESLVNTNNDPITGTDNR